MAQGSRFALVIMTKCFSLSRLETRTKESDIYASTGVLNSVRNESVVFYLYGQNPPDMILREKVLSVSIHVGTRKMVNYA